MKDHPYHTSLWELATYQAKTGLALVRNTEGPDESHSN